jgi:hypothetical protein
MGYMDFYELRAAMEPPRIVGATRLVVGGEKAFVAHLWKMWDTRGFLPITNTVGLPIQGRPYFWYGQHNQFIAPKMELEDHVEKMFCKELTSCQAKVIWQLGQVGPSRGAVGDGWVGASRRTLFNLAYNSNQKWNNLLLRKERRN